MADTILSILEKCMRWFRWAVDASSYAFSVPAGGTLSAMHAMTPQFMLLRSSRVPTTETTWDIRTFTLGTVLALVTIFAVRYIRSPWRKLPPGPRGLPILGNALQLMDKKWLFSRDCKERFGEIMYLNAGGQPTIVFNSLKSALDLLEHRANNYSGRPRFIMAHEILSNGLIFVLMDYNDLWRRMRRAAHEALAKTVLQRYYPIQTKEATILVSSVLTPSVSLNPDKQFQRLTASTIMSIVYDHPTIVSEHDHTVKQIEQFNCRISESALPGAHFVDIFPWMVHIPERFAKWKREGLKQFTKDYAMFKSLLDRVRADLANGGTRPSFTASLIQNHERNRLSELEMSYLSGTLYAAAAETTSGALSWWALAMIKFPDVQRRAQTELDAVVGRDRLPTFADAPHLPYVRAIIEEVLRLRPVVPLAVPHAATEDDWYEGMFIPKGTVCIPNIWHCNRDRTVFGEDADEFRPERYIDEHGELSSGSVKSVQAGHGTFGFGRRVCVGNYLASNMLFITTARMLWAAKIEGTQDDNGKEVPLDMEAFVDTGLTIRPVPYDCVFKPRFPEVVSILAEEHERFEN